MPLYHLRINDGRQVRSDISVDRPTRDAAWAALTHVCSNLIPDVTSTEASRRRVPATVPQPAHSLLEFNSLTAILAWPFERSVTIS